MQGRRAARRTCTTSLLSRYAAASPVAPRHSHSRAPTYPIVPRYRPHTRQCRFQPAVELFSAWANSSRFAARARAPSAVTFPVRRWSTTSWRGSTGPSSPTARPGAPPPPPPLARPPARVPRGAAWPPPTRPDPASVRAAAFDARAAAFPLPMARAGPASLHPPALSSRDVADEMCGSGDDSPEHSQVSTGTPC